MVFQSRLLLFSFFFFFFSIFLGVTYGKWREAHATFYTNNLVEMGGACGYGDVVKAGDTEFTAALSYELFQNGSTCGACYELQCHDDPTWCIPNTIVTVSATNSCPPSDKPSNNGGWCNPPRAHFDLSHQAFLQIVNSFTAGIVPVLYRRVDCKKEGNIKFTFFASTLMLITNVGGAGDVSQVWQKCSDGWYELDRNWGQNWNTRDINELEGKSFKFKVIASDGRKVAVTVNGGWTFNNEIDVGVQFA